LARTAPGNVVGPRTNFANGGFDRDHDRFRGGRFVRLAFGVFTFGRPTYYDYMTTMPPTAAGSGAWCRYHTACAGDWWTSASRALRHQNI